MRKLLIVLCTIVLAGCVIRTSDSTPNPTVTPEQTMVIETNEPTVVPTATPEPTTVTTPEPTPVPTPTLEPTPTPGVSSSVDPSVFSDTSSLLILANKKHPLPSGYVPENLVRPNIPQTLECWMVDQAAWALEQMAADAASDGVTLMISSAYRSEAYQSQLYYGYVNSYGVERADTISSRPGYSDHQTGLCCDFVEGNGSFDGINFTQSFEDSASGTWLRDNAHKYGFIMRYPKGKQEITGYAYEPWHYRYIGIDYATAIYNVDVFESFEEYFGVEGGDYY